MTVSTPYFNLVFSQIGEAEESIEALNKRIARGEQRIDNIQSRPVNAKRIEKIAKIEAANAARVDRIDTLEDNIILFESVLPKDTFEFAYWMKDGVRSGVQVTITDSPYDDTYVGGSEADLRLNGAGRKTEFGVSGFGHTRGGIVAGDYAPIDESKTVGFSSSLTQRDLSEYPQLTISLLPHNGGEAIWTQQLKVDGVDVQDFPEIDPFV